ncbi:hypothetical protein [Liberiplasma polymorphum]|uniref:hypothetical protein n=1 Tax=Liberiplasma polymorphum TaxID=3374570 RepID=UPI003773F080
MMEDKLVFCDVCEKQVKTSLRTIEKTYTHKNKSVTLDVTERYCLECKTQVYDDELDQKSSEEFVNRYNILYISKK